jgi:TolA-binding protein
MKNLKKLIFHLLLVLLMMTVTLLAQTGQTAGAKEQKLFQAGKDAIYKKDWNAAVEQWQNFSTLFPQSQRGAEPYYWLAYSLNQAAKESGDFEKQTAMREQAMNKVEMLLKNFSDSSWASDARMLRIELAETLAKAGKTQYKKYITHGAEAENGSDINVKLVALDALM